MEKGFGVRGLESLLGDILAHPIPSAPFPGSGGGGGGAGGGGLLARVPSVALQLGAVRGEAQGLVVALGELSGALGVRPLGAAGALASLRAVHSALGKGAKGLISVVLGLDAVQVSS